MHGRGELLHFGGIVRVMSCTDAEPGGNESIGIMERDSSTHRQTDRRMNKPGWDANEQQQRKDNRERQSELSWEHHRTCLAVCWLRERD